MLQFSRHFSERHNPCPFQSSEVGCFMFFSAVSAGFSLALDSTFRLKGKCIYTALIFVVHAGMDHTVQLHQCLPSSPHSATTPMPAKFTSQAFTRWRSPDWGHGHPIVAYYSLIYPKKMKGWIGLVSCRSSAAQGKFAGPLAIFYHCATQPTRLGGKVGSACEEFEDSKGGIFG